MPTLGKLKQEHRCKFKASLSCISWGLKGQPGLYSKTLSQNNCVVNYILIYLFYVCCCFACMCLYEDVGSPETRVTNGCEPPCMLVFGCKHICASQAWGQKRAMDSLEWNYKQLVSFQVSAENWTWVLSRRTQDSADHRAIPLSRYILSGKEY